MKYWIVDNLQFIFQEEKAEEWEAGEGGLCSLTAVHSSGRKHQPNIWNCWSAAPNYNNINDMVTEFVRVDVSYYQ